MIRKILALTDGSEISRNALRYATEICRQFNAELYLSTVIDKVPSSMGAELSKGAGGGTLKRWASVVDMKCVFCESSALTGLRVL